MIIDILFILIITLTIMTCYKKGFAVSLFNAASTIISVILVCLFKEPVTDFIKNSSFGTAYHEKLYDIFNEKFVNEAGELINTENLPGFLSDAFKRGTESAGEAISFLTDKVFDISVFIVSFIILMIIVKLITSFSPKIIKVFTKLPIIKQFDKVFGACFGIITGTVWSVVFVYLIGVISVYIDFEFLNEQLINSFVSGALNSIDLSNILF